MTSIELMQPNIKSKVQIQMLLQYLFSAQCSGQGFFKIMELLNKARKVTGANVSKCGDFYSTGMYHSNQILL